MLAAEPMHLTDLAQATRRRMRSMGQFLDLMIQQGWIVRLSHGRYWLRDPLADALRLPETDVYEGLPAAEVARLKRIAAREYG